MHNDEVARKYCILLKLYDLPLITMKLSSSVDIYLNKKIRAIATWGTSGVYIIRAQGLRSGCSDAL
jgi:hypothetical protein